MTENDWIELVEAKSPDELTAEELAGLNGALARSPELRQALAQRLELDQYLHAALSHHQVSADEILASAAKFAAARSRARNIRWMLGLTVLGLAIATFLHTSGFRPRDFHWPGQPRGGDVETVAAAPPDAPPHVDGDEQRQADANTPANDATSPPSADASAAPAAPAVADAAPAESAANPAQRENSTAKPPAAEAALAAPKAQQTKAPEAQRAKAPEAQPAKAPAGADLPLAGADHPHATADPAPAASAPPAGPWTPLATIAAEPPPDDAALADDLRFDTPAPREADLRKWFAKVPGQASSFGSQALYPFAVQCSVFSGLVRLQSPWAPEAALRMSLHDSNLLRIHLWSESDGVSLQYLQYHNRQWLAYRATRQPGQPIPETLVLIGQDEGRNDRVNVTVPEIGTLDLRCDGKTLSLSRRNVPILSVPFAGMPREVYFEGKALFRQLQLVRAADLPAARAPGPVVQDVTQPAQQKWRTAIHEGAAFNLLPDGRAELSLSKDTATAWAALPLANDRIQEVILQLDDPQPGAGVFMGDAAGKSSGGLGFFREARAGQLAVAQGNPGELRVAINLDSKALVQSFCSTKPWVKMLVGCGANRFWISEDGEHWARACAPWVNQRAVIGSVGLYCNPGPTPRSIALRRLIVRELPALAALAPLELRRQAPVAADDLVPSEWLSAACLSQPAGVDARQWRRACALRTLAANAAPSAAPTVLDGLVEDVLSEPDRPWREQVQLLDETCSLRNCLDDARLAQRCEEQYARVGARAAAAGHPEAFAAALQAQLMAPLWTHHDPAQGIEDADRQQILQLVYDRDWARAETLSRHLRLTRHMNQDQDAILDWAEAIAPRQANAGAATKAIMKPEWRHPIVVELSKEAYNVLAELEAAVESNAYRDACQIISTASAQDSAAGGSGLLPDSHDPELLLSFANAVRKAMREHPALSAAMNEQLGPTGRLRVRQAMADEDAAAVEAATLQFCGTQAAADAHRWLGDRAVASGAFAQAIAHYDECVKTAAPETRAKAMSGMRLAAAMLGRPAPEGAVGPAEFGDARLSAAEFSRLLDDLRQSRSASATGVAIAPPAGAPSASAFAAHVRGRLDGDAGENPQDVPGELQPLDVDWVARQCSVVPAGDRLIVSNRFQVSAFNVKSNRYDWRAMSGGEQASAHDWSLTPMRPLVTTQRVFVRRLTKDGPLLAALDSADGKLLWTSRPDSEKSVISDPVLIQDQIFALVSAKADQEFTLSLASYDPASGAPISFRQLARLREAWWRQQRSCQVAALENSLVVACGGSVLRVDVAGRIGWLRRATWTPAALDRAGGAQDSTPPIVAGDRIFVAQPGVRQIQCLDPESGRMIWQTATPTLRRLVGLAGERLVIQSDSGFAAFSAADGKPLWEHPVSPVAAPGSPPIGSLDGQMLSDSNALLIAKSVPVGDGKNFTPTLAWIDLANGRERATWALDALQHERPRLGPLAMADGRLFALSGRGEHDAQRDIVELVAQGPAWNGPGEQQAELSLWRGPLDPALWEAATEVLPRWSLLGGATDRKHPLRVAEWQGETQVLEVQAASGRPFTLARRGRVPPGSPKLVARVASDAKWKLDVQAGDKIIASQTFDPGSTGGGWRDIELNLDPVAGQTVWLVVRQIAVDGSNPLVKWKSLEIRE